MDELLIAAAVVTVGYFAGSAREKAHFRELKKREAILLTIIPTRADMGAAIQNGETFLVVGNVVVASDAFKNFVGNLRNFFGGRLTTYESLLDRARREAICRMRERALQQGADEVVNVRIETSFLDKLGIEVFAYGTAVKR